MKQHVKSRALERGCWTSPGPELPETGSWETHRTLLCFRKRLLQRTNTPSNLDKTQEALQKDILCIYTLFSSISCSSFPGLLWIWKSHLVSLISKVSFRVKDFLQSINTGRSIRDKSFSFSLTWKCLYSPLISSFIFPLLSFCHQALRLQQTVIFFQHWKSVMLLPFYLPWFQMRNLLSLTSLFPQHLSSCCLQDFLHVFTFQKFNYVVSSCIIWRVA